MASIQLSLFSRTLTDSLQVTPDEILQAFSRKFGTAGRMTLHGECWTANISVFPKDVTESSLSQILQENVPEKFYLSKKAREGILRRARSRNVSLPEAMEKALVAP